MSTFASRWNDLNFGSPQIQRACESGLRCVISLIRYFGPGDFRIAAYDQTGIINLNFQSGDSPLHMVR
ncbi:hypothetical protein NNRS527_02541 [Nitrosospira sp. NRS527]|nr:hypothetical protein NNRS527_02541 [Nitrosospira sp. NRS527]